MSAPTCIGHGRNRLTLGVGTSVVDHVLRVRRGEAGPPTLPSCITLDHATHGPGVQPLASDQCPVIFFCGRRSHTATGKRTSRVTFTGDWSCCISSKSGMRINLPCGTVRIPRSISRLQSLVTNTGLTGWPPQ